MDRTAFKQRMQSLKTYREQNPDKGYWDWKIQAFENGGETIPIRGTSVYNNYGDTTHYIPASLEDSTLNLSLPDVVITPRNNLNLASVVTEGRNKIGRAGGELLSMTTPVGDVESVYEIGKDISTGNYSQAAIGAGLMLLPNFIEKSIKPIRRLFKKSKINKELENVILPSNNIENILDDNIDNISIDKHNINESDHINTFQIYDADNQNNNTILLDAKNNVQNDDIQNTVNIISQDTPNAIEQNITTTDYNLFDDLDQYRATDMFDRYYLENIARNKGLFDQRFDDAVEDIRNAIQYDENIITRYQNLLDYRNATVQDANELYQDVLNREYTRRNLNLFGSADLNKLYDQYRHNSLNLPSLIDISNARDNLRDRIELDRIREYINNITQFRNRIRNIPEEQWTQELYDRLSTEYSNIRYFSLPIIRNRENRNIAGDLEQQLHNVRDEIDNIGKIFQRRRQDQMFNQFNNSNISVSSRNNENNTVYSNLISENLYDKNNLPEEFKKSKYEKGDITSASYFNMSPREAVEKGTRDFKRLKHGQAWNLTSDYAVSTDSYPLQLSLMTKYKDDGFIKVFKDKDNNTSMMQLNNFGNLKEDAAISRINKKLQQISNITGEKDLKAVEVGTSIFVPRISYRKYKDGGEIDDNSPVRVNPYTGKPLASGAITPVMDLRTAADFTPIGDALAVNDTYQAIKENDWLGAGLSALAVVPFIPTVNKRYVQDAIDQMLSRNAKNIQKATDLNNQTYEVIQRLTDDPSYMNRANRVKEKYGDDYTQIYADLIDAYNTNPDILPKAMPTEFSNGANGRISTTKESTKRHKQGGEFPKLGEYEYQFAKDTDLPEGITVHETNHLSDFLKNKTSDADGNSNLFYQMRQAIKPYADGNNKYYSNMSEQKAYMNQLREYMYNKGLISNRDQQVDGELLKKTIEKLPSSMNSVKRASKQFKSMRQYTKWFNTIPLLGVGAITANNYYTQQENK